MIPDIFSSFLLSFIRWQILAYVIWQPYCTSQILRLKFSYHFIKSQVGSTLFKLGLVEMLRADAIATNKSLSSIEKARTTYDKAEDMLRQAIRYYTRLISFKVYQVQINITPGCLVTTSIK